MPTLLLAFFILQGEREYSIALLDRVFSFGIVRLEGAVNGIKRNGRREGVCVRLDVCLIHNSSRRTGKNAYRSLATC